MTDSPTQAVPGGAGWPGVLVLPLRMCLWGWKPLWHTPHKDRRARDTERPRTAAAQTPAGLRANAGRAPGVAPRGQLVPVGHHHPLAEALAAAS